MTEKTFRPNQKLLILGGTVALLAVAIAFLWSNIAHTWQAANPVSMKVRFVGEYQQADGGWQRLAPDAHIPALQGDVTLRGQFHLIAPDTGADFGAVPAGTVVALYCNHINLRITEGDLPPKQYDTENPVLGDDACGAFWSGYVCEDAGQVVIEIHNPHSYGNPNAVDQLLRNMAVYTDNLFENEVRSEGIFHRGVAMLFLLAALILLGISFFAFAVHIRDALGLLFVGLMTLFGGAYFLLDTPSVSFWFESVIVTTSLTGLSMMFYMLVIDVMILSFLERCGGPLCVAVVAALGVAELVTIAVPLFTDVYYYDLWPLWIILQAAAGIPLGCRALRDLGKTGDKKKKCRLLGCLVALAAFDLDAAATGIGWWEGGMASKWVFLMLFLAGLFFVIWVIPQNINAVAKTKELETEQRLLQAELQRSRVAMMMSQIRPHFIYNTLSSIEMLCAEKPREAAALAHDFSEYLQVNFRHVDDAPLILFSQEIEHVKHYTNIEKVRFEDITVCYDLQTVDFMLPPLTVQPLVENAIKHGLMGLEEGGTITVRTEETPTHYCVTVTDDGIGFDVNVVCDDQKCVGIRSIRGRLQAFSSGTLEIESAPGKGTTACIRIPK